MHRPRPAGIGVGHSPGAASLYLESGDRELRTTAPVPPAGRRPPTRLALPSTSPTPAPASSPRPKLQQTAVSSSPRRTAAFPPTAPPTMPFASSRRRRRRRPHTPTTAKLSSDSRPPSNSKPEEPRMSLFQKLYGFEPHVSVLDRPREGDQELPDEDKVEVLHMARCNEFTECDPKYGDCRVCTRFDICYNLAFFDLDEESKVGLGPPLSVLSPSVWEDSLDSSVNVISLKITESDLDYPINVFGSVLARDEVDYKCIYLFRRDRDDPQIITSPDDALTLTGPNRGLAVASVMYFEINLKVRCDGTGDRALSKGVLQHDVWRHSNRTINLRRLSSWLSTVELARTNVLHDALEATLAVTVLKGPPDFSAKLTAWTTGNEDGHIVLFDSEASGTMRAVSDDGSVALSRRVVSVAWDEELVLRISVGDEHSVQAMGRSAEKRFCRIGSYELKVEVHWTGNVTSRRKRVLRRLGATLVLV